MSHAPRLRALHKPPAQDPPTLTKVHVTGYEKPYMIWECTTYQLGDLTFRKAPRRLIGHPEGYVCWRVANEQLKRIVREDRDYWKPTSAPFITAKVKRGPIELLSVKRLFTEAEAAREPDVPAGQRIWKRKIKIEQSPGGMCPGTIRKTMPANARVNPRIELPARPIPVFPSPPRQAATGQSSTKTSPATASTKKRLTSTATAPTASSTAKAQGRGSAVAPTTKVSAATAKAPAVTKATTVTAKASASTKATAKVPAASTKATASTAKAPAATAKVPAVTKETKTPSALSKKGAGKKAKGKGKEKEEEEDRRSRSPEVDVGHKRQDLIDIANDVLRTIAEKFTAQKLSELGLPPLDDAHSILEAWIKEAKAASQNVRERGD